MGRPDDTGTSGKEQADTKGKERHTEGSATGARLTRLFEGKLSPRRLILPVVTIALIAGMLSFTATLAPGGEDEPQASEQPVVVPPEPSDTATVSGSVVPTSTWVNYYGLENLLYGEPVPAGAVITAHDPQGVVCGEFTVETPGRYGLMPVYGDDASTDVDEGAESGDQIEFRIDGIPVTAVGPDEPVWADMGDLKRVDLVAAIAR